MTMNTDETKLPNYINKFMTKKEFRNDEVRRKKDREKGWRERKNVISGRPPPLHLLPFSKQSN